MQGKYNSLKAFNFFFKQKRACLDNKNQNFKGKFWQCRPKATTGPSVCRQCCKNGEQCENFDGVNYAGWKANLLQ